MATSTSNTSQDKVNRYFVAIQGGLRALGCTFIDDVSVDKLTGAGHPFRFHLLSWLCNTYDKSLLDMHSGTEVEQLCKALICMGLSQATGRTIVEGDCTPERSLSFIRSVVELVVVRTDLRAEKEARYNQAKALQEAQRVQEAQDDESHDAENSAPTMNVPEAKVSSTTKVAAASSSSTQATDKDELSRSLMLLRYIAPNEKKILSSECRLFSSDILLNSSEVLSEQQLVTQLAEAKDKVSHLQREVDELKQMHDYKPNERFLEPLNALTRALFSLNRNLEAFSAGYDEEFEPWVHQPRPHLTGLGASANELQRVYAALNFVRTNISSIRKAYTSMLSSSASKRLMHLQSTQLNEAAISSLDSAVTTLQKSIQRRSSAKPDMTASLTPSKSKAVGSSYSPAERKQRLVQEANALPFM